MRRGCSGRILHVDPAEGKLDVEETSDVSHHKYTGGGAMGAYFLVKHSPAIGYLPQLARVFRKLGQGNAERGVPLWHGALETNRATTRKMSRCLGLPDCLPCVRGAMLIGSRVAPTPCGGRI